jgi:hypothetical protein
MTYTVKINWLKELEKTLWPVNFLNAVNTAIKKAIIFIEWEAKKNTPVWVSWTLRNAYRTKFSPLKWELYNIEKYWLYVHEWTKPHWVWIKNIQKWADVKWINPYVLQRSIAKKWTKANKWMDKTYNENISEVYRLIDDTLFSKL